MLALKMGFGVHTIEKNISCSLVPLYINRDIRTRGLFSLYNSMKISVSGPYFTINIIESLYHMASIFTYEQKKTRVFDRKNSFDTFLSLIY